MYKSAVTEHRIGILQFNSSESTKRKKIRKMQHGENKDNARK